MTDDTQPPPRTDLLDRWVGWFIILALLGMVTFWGSFILAHIPHQIVVPSRVVATLIVLGLVFMVVALGGLFICYRYLRRLAHRPLR